MSDEYKRDRGLDSFSLDRGLDSFSLKEKGVLPKGVEPEPFLPAPHGPIYEAALRYHAAIRAWQASEGGRAQTEEANEATAALRSLDAAYAVLRAGVHAMQDDMTELMEVLGLPTHARHASPHSVMQTEVIPMVRELRRKYRDALDALDERAGMKPRA